MSDSEDSSQDQRQEYAIKPVKGVASIDTSDWPLLLKVSLFIPKKQVSVDKIA